MTWPRPEPRRPDRGVPVYFNDLDYDEMKARAEALGMTTSAYIRWLVKEAAKNAASPPE